MQEGDGQARLALLLRRAGLAARPSDWDHYVSLGWQGTLDELLHPERVQEDLDELLGGVQGHLLDLQNIEDVQTWWLYRMVQTRRPLLEKLTLFWHGHFAVANYKVQNPLAMHQHLDLLRARGLGSFDDLLLGVSQDPAMLVWLDGNTNRKGAPNENYGRELLELFTLGIGNYTETDVKAAAQSFTGWNLRDGAFFFDKGQHDTGDKTFLGQTGDLDGTDVVTILAGHPATAERICRKLFAYFAYPNPAPEVLQPLIDTYLQRGHDIRSVLDALFRSDAFASDASLHGHIKSPVEYVVGTIRQLGAEMRERDLVGTLRSMGQEILNPPNVAGWPGDASWVNPSTMLTRFNFVARLATARGEPYDGGKLVPQTVLGSTGVADPQLVLAQVRGALGGLSLSSDAEQALVDFIQSPLTYPPTLKGNPNAAQQQLATDARLRDALLLALASTDYQVG